MASLKGKDFLLYDGTGTGTVLLASQKTTSFKLNGEMVDVTNKDSGGFRELLAAAGITSLSISAEGLVASGTGQDLMFTRTSAKTLNNYTLRFGGTTGTSDDVVTGSFQMTSFEEAGEYNGVQTFKVDLESSGSFTFTPGS